MAADSSLTSLHAALRKDCDELLGRLGAVMNGVERMGTGAMTEDEIHELLFTHWDEDRDGTISIKELGKMVCELMQPPETKRTSAPHTHQADLPSPLLTVCQMQLLQNNPKRGAEEALRSSIVTVLRYDRNNDTRLSRDETRSLVNELVATMGVELHVVAGILLMAPYSVSMQRYTEAHGAYNDHSSAAAAVDAMDASHDARMRELFVLFDEGTCCCEVNDDSTGDARGLN